ncbi:MAG: hypothetical protein D3907_10145 [Candidatus Electrothrix sp. AUS3]|nr:hypothetical protein [Candidatus Electrothrix gigas]
MAKKPTEMAEVLIRLYKERKKKKIGKYLLSKEGFKEIAGKTRLRDSYVRDVDLKLREDGFLLIDMREEKDQIALLSIKTIMRYFEELSSELIEKYRDTDNNDDEW